MSAVDQDQPRLSGDTCGGDQLFLPGDLVWGKLIDQQWWPGQVQDISSNSDSKSVSTQEKNEETLECFIIVAFFDEFPTLTVCDPSELRLFESDEFKSIASDIQLRERGAAFSAAVMVALDELRRRLEVGMTCKCFPEVSKCHLDEPRVGLSYGFSMAEGLGVKEFLQKFLDAARDASRVDLLDAVVMRSWIVAFFRMAGRYAPLPEYHKFQGIEDISEVKDEPQERETVEMIVVDTDRDASGEEDVGNVKDLISRKCKNKREEEEETKHVINVGDSGGGGDEEGLGLRRRERKKSKYLSPPYTMINSTNLMHVSPKVSGSLKHEDDSTLDEVSRLKPMAKCSKKLFVFDKNNDVSTYKLLSELRFLALDSRYIIDNMCNEIFIGFFDRFRNSKFVKCYYFEDYNRENNCLGSSDGGEVSTADSERDISSLEGKSDGFQIANDSRSNYSGMTGKKRKCLVHNSDTNEETNARILCFDVNIPPEAHENCSCLEANGLTETNGSLESKPKKARKGKSATDKPNGSIEVKRRRGRPRKVVGTTTTSTTQPFKSGNSSTPVSAGQKDVLFPRIPSSDIQLYLDNPIPPPSLSLPLPKPPLCFVKKSLERMITTLNNSGSNGEDAKSSTQLKPEAREKLVGEMSCLLTKVNKMLTNATAATAMSSPGANVHSST